MPNGDADDREPYQCTGVTCKTLDSDCSVGAAYDARYTDNGFKGHAISAHLGDDQQGLTDPPISRTQCCLACAAGTASSDDTPCVTDKHDTTKCPCKTFPKFRKAKLTWGSEKGAAYVFLSACIFSGFTLLGCISYCRLRDGCVLLHVILRRGAGTPCSNTNVHMPFRV